MAPPNTLPTFGFPQQNAPLVDEQRLVTRPWYQFFRNLAIQRGALVGLADSAQAIPSGVLTPVAWDLATWDVGGFWNSATPTKLFVPNVPIYKLNLKAGLQAIGTTTTFLIAFRLNGIGPTNGTPQFNSPGGVNASATIAGTILVKPGDYVELCVRATGAGLTMAQFLTFADVEVLQ